MELTNLCIITKCDGVADAQNIQILMLYVGVRLTMSFPFFWGHWLVLCGEGNHLAVGWNFHTISDEELLMGPFLTHSIVGQSLILDSAFFTTLQHKETTPFA